MTRANLLALAPLAITIYFSLSLCLQDASRDAPESRRMPGPERILASQTGRQFFDTSDGSPKSVHEMHRTLPGIVKRGTKEKKRKSAKAGQELISTEDGLPDHLKTGPPPSNAHVESSESLAHRTSLLDLNQGTRSSHRHHVEEDAKYVFICWSPSFTDPERLRDARELYI